jgi:thioredoxin
MFHNLSPHLEKIMSLPITTDSSFATDVLASPTPVLVDFTADWCPPCRVMEPVLRELAADRPELKIVAVDVEASQLTAARHEVLSMPTFILFRAGAPVLRLVGSRPRRRLERELDAVL